jgi:hypothetical protein
MKKFLIVLIALCVIVPFAQADDSTSDDPTPHPILMVNDLANCPSGRVCVDRQGNSIMGSAKFIQYTVATLPATLGVSDAGLRFEITDGADTEDCTVGGGNDIVTCRWSGSAYANVGDGTAAGSAEVSDATVGDAGNNDTSHAYSKDDIRDYVYQHDSDFDGLPDGVEATSITSDMLAGTLDLSGKTVTFGLESGDIPDISATYQSLLTNSAGLAGALSDETGSGAAVFAESPTLVTPALGTIASGVGTALTALNGENIQDDTIDDDSLDFTDITLNDFTFDVGSVDKTEFGYLNGVSSAIQDQLNGKQATVTEGSLSDSVIVSADVKDNTLTASDLAAALTFSESDLIDLSAITMSAGVDEGIALPTYADVAPSTEKFYLAYDAANNVLMVRESGGWVNASAGSGAATTLNFLTTQAEGSLSTESVFTDGYGIDHTDAGGDGGAFTVGIDTTEISADGSDTWSDGSQASIVWTFDVSGTDHTMTAGNGLMTFGDAVTVTDTLTATNGIALGASKSITGTTGLTIGGGTETVAINSSDWDIDATGIMTGIGNITSNGVVTATGFTIGSAAITETELEIIDGATISTTDLNIIDGISDSGTLTAGELLYVDGVTSSIQNQLDARCLESVFGTAIEADDLALNGTTLELAAEIPHIDAAQNISADWEWQDGIPISFGNGNDWEVAYDEAADDRLEFTHTAGAGADVIFDLNDNAADSTFTITNSNGTYEANGVIEGDLDVGGALTAASITADASSSPGWSAADSDADAVGTFTFSIDAYTAGYDSQIIFKVDDSGGEDQTYATYDGSLEQVTFAKPVVASSTMQSVGTFTIGTTGTLSEETNTLTFDDGDGDPITLQEIRNIAAGVEDNDLETDGALGITNAEIFIGTGAGTGNYAALSGEATMTNAGVVSIANTGVVLTSLTVGSLLGVDSIAATGAVDMDYGNGSITDHTFTTDGGTVVLDGTITATGAISGNNVNPDTANGATLGTDALEWSDLFLADGAVIYGQNDQSNTITSAANGWTFGLDLVVAGGDISVGIGGVQLTGDGDGAITLLGLGDGSDENLIINLDDTADHIVLSSSTGVTDVDFTAMNINTTGVIKGRASYGSDITGAVSHNTTATHGVFYHFTAAATVTLDAAADAGYGAQVCYKVRDAAEAAVIDVDDAEKINLNGTAQAAGVAITATGAGESICLVSTTDTDGSGTDGWETWGATSGWASE